MLHRMLFEPLQLLWEQDRRKWRKEVFIFVRMAKPQRLRAGSEEAPEVLWQQFEA